MIGIRKAGEQRRNQLVYNAEKIFIVNGYNETRISNIVEEANVAKSTFYYYFKSKKEIFLSVFDIYIERNIGKLKIVLSDNTINEIEKISSIVKKLLILKEKDMPLIKCLHEQQNEYLHQLVMLNSVKKYAFIISEIIEQGIRNKVFKTNYPNQVAEYFWLSFKFIHDTGIVVWNEEEHKNNIYSLTEQMNKILEVSNGTFKFIN